LIPSKRTLELTNARFNYLFAHFKRVLIENITRGVNSMHKLTKVFILAMFSLISAQSSYANYPSYGENPNYPQGQAAYSQNLYNQGTPDMSAENAFMQQSGNRMTQMMQANRNMVSQDRTMMRQGYDPNENYYGGAASNIQGPYRSYPNQEQMMQGQYQGNYSQGGYTQDYNNAAIPQSYPLNNSYPHAPRNDNNFNAPRYYSQQRGNMGGYTPGYNIPPRGNRSSYSNPPAGYGYYEHPVYHEEMMGYSAHHYGDMMTGYPAYHEGIMMGHEDSNQDHPAHPGSYPLNENYPNAPRNDNQQGASGNKMISYDYQSYPYQYDQYRYDQYIGDSTHDQHPSSRTSRGVSNTDTNASWDTTDDQTIRQSSANTSQSSRWNESKK
jgi:hypothetical protein